MRHIGFTGTQRGMTEIQRSLVWQLIQFTSGLIAHHGDCVGADAEFHDIAGRVPGLLFRILHPSNIDSMRARCAVGPLDIVLPAAPPLVRNQDMVAACEAIIATPKEPNMALRSGTWTTIRMARRAGRPLAIVNPDGWYLLENGWHTPGSA